MHVPVNLAVLLAIVLGPCISAVKATSPNLKNRHARSTSEKSDKLHAFKRIKRQAGTSCMTTILASSSFQQFLSNDIGMDYGNSVNCQWRIRAPDNKVVVLRFPRFIIEGISGCLFDSVRINGTGVNEALCGIGPNCTGNFPTKEYVTTGNIMYILFSTDAGLTYPGFTAEYRYADSPYRAQNFTTTDFDRSCLVGDNATMHNGSTRNPDTPVVRNCSSRLIAGDNVKQMNFTYDNSMSCQWNITTTDPIKRVAVRFKTFSVEGIRQCVYDFVTVNDTQGEISGRLCGRGLSCTGNFPNQVYVSRGRDISVAFVSDATVVSGGFVMEYYAVGPMYVAEAFTTTGNTSSVCSETEVPSGNGTVSTPVLTNGTAVHANCSRNLTATSNWLPFQLTTAEYYHNTARCLFKITAPVGKVVVLRFTRFDVEYSIGCLYDRVSVYNSDGQPTDFCGNRVGCHQEFPTSELLSSGNNMTIFFISDGSVIGEGFAAQFRFSDPGYVGQVFMTQGSSNVSGPCHTESASTTPTVPLQSWPCHMNLTAASSLQTIRTPEISPFNRNYPDDVRCRWVISGPATALIKLGFQSFDVEGAFGCTYDHVTVSDGLGSLNNPMCGRSFQCLGNFPEMELISRSNYMVVEFQSDGSLNFKGFRATYQTVGPWYAPRNISMDIVGSPNVTCSNHNVTMSTASSPQVGVNNCSRNLTAIATPQHFFSQDVSVRTYNNNMLCLFNITAPPDKKVLVRFVYFDMEGESNCEYDSVSLSSGAESLDERLCGNGYYCVGNFPKNEYISSGNQAFVILETDESVTFSGFEAEYFFVDESYEAQGHVADENRTLTDRQCSVCPNYRVNLVDGTRFGVPRGQSAEVYPANLDCQWELNSNTSALVNLTLFWFDIEESEGCIYDAVVIWDHEEVEKMRICGNSDQPQSFVFTGPLYIDFRTNGDVSGAGFIALFETVRPNFERQKRSLTRRFRNKRGHS